MHQRRNITLAAAVGTAALVAWACDRSETPAAPDVGTPSFWAGEQPACFRLTGGGRIDKPEPLVLLPQPKNTPESRDFATFGFQARPNDCTTTAGSGQIEWVEHNPAAVLGGFSFHGVVNEFALTVDHYGESGDPRNGCGLFRGAGRAHGRDGSTFEDVPFVVEHACDRGEPGVGRDHIRICIGTADAIQCATGSPPPRYRRDGILTGGNIQKHRLTGSGA
ncbi:MAG: hypothetical protein ACREME_06395 [Gemmatimonadales bacterium]